VTTTKKQSVITCNLNEIDTEPRLDDRSAELDGNGRVIQGSDGCATGRGKLRQGICAIPRALGILPA
jgi:hypothetical protein